jgi:hypothetical protein
MIASAVVLVQVPVLARLSLKVLSIMKSTLKSVQIAALAQQLALLRLSLKNNSEVLLH